MKFRVLKEDFESIVAVAAKAVSTKTSIEVLKGMLLVASDGKVEATGYDSIKHVTASTSAVIIEEGCVVVDKNLSELISHLPDGVEIECTEVEGVFTVRCTSGVYKFSSMDASSYPELPTVEKAVSFQMSAQDLSKAFRTIQHVPQPFAATSRPIFSGVNLEYHKKAGFFRCVALDGYRVAFADTEIAESSADVDFSAIVPVETLKFLIRVVDKSSTVKISQGYKDGRFITFEAENINVVSTLIEGTYFDYLKVLKIDESICLEIDKKSFLDSCERVFLATGDIKNPLVLTLTSTSVQVSSKSALGAAEENVDNMTYIQKPSDTFVIGFNQRYLSDAVKAIDDDTFVMRLSNPLSGVVLEPKDHQDSQQFVLPVRLAAN